MPVDSKCGKTYGGGRTEHCTACHETFSGSSAGDRHRIGRHGVDRRCRTRAEMVSLGMTQNARGVWTNGGDYWSDPTRGES
jgi:hypothetical protein